jgi:hypothetical protein
MDRVEAHKIRFAAGRLTTFLAVMGLAIFVVGCSSQNGIGVTAPSAVGSTALKPAGAVDESGTTTVGFTGFNASTLTVTINTATSSPVGQPYIDQGKIHLQILVDSSGNPVPCGTAGATWERIDGAGGGLVISGGHTAHVTDLDDLHSVNSNVNNAKCGDKICIRAQYVTGGGQTKVATHFSDPTPFEIICASACTLTQGFWKTHYPDEWPAVVISGGLTLGTVPYTATQLESIFNTPVGGNGLISLAHQLIAAKLNIANGVSSSTIASAMASADGMIGGLIVPPVGSGALAPSATGALTTTLDNFNSGVTGPGHCQSE